jgi:DNA-binding MarR family transcriptional regulator
MLTFSRFFLSAGAMAERTNQSREYILADRLHSAAIHLLRLVRVQDLKTGIGPARLSALSVLVFGGPKSLKELAEIEQVQPPTMSRIVAGLEEHRLIRRAVSASDRRQIRLEVTERGKRILQEARQRRVSELAARLGPLSQDELSALEEAVRLLGKVVGNK